MYCSDLANQLPRTEKTLTKSAVVDGKRSKLLK